MDISDSSLSFGLTQAWGIICIIFKSKNENIWIKDFCFTIGLTKYMYSHVAICQLSVVRKNFAGNYFSSDFLVAVDLKPRTNGMKQIWSRICLFQRREIKIIMCYFYPGNVLDTSHFSSHLILTAAFQGILFSLSKWEIRGLRSHS